MEQPTIREDSPAWLFFVHAAFAFSVFLMCLGTYELPVNLWVKGYFAMGLFFTVGSTVTLSKTLRDQHERRKLVNRLNEVKTEKLLNDYNLAR
jgi:hypothetical protein